jgi:acid phosphatase type 7
MARFTRRRVQAGAAFALLLAVLALTLPDRCTSNELGHHHADPTGDLQLGPVPRGERQEVRFARACGSSVLHRAADQAGPILRSPYLQQVTESSAQVLWTSGALAAPAVDVWAGDRPGGPVRDAPVAVDSGAPLPRGLQYVARLGPLSAGTLHCYRVRDGRRVLAGPFGFMSAPAPGSERPIRLVAFGDMGYQSIDQSAVLEGLGRVEFDLALLAGDIAYPAGRLAELEGNVFAVYAPLMRNAPFWPATGNHDYLTDDAAPFRRSFALPENGGPTGVERWYSFDWGDLHVVVLDSERLVAEQVRWLEADLSAHADAPWTIALLHRAPFSSGEHGPHLPTRDAFVPVLTRHRVALVLAGHEHNYERFHPQDSVTYVVSGGGGRGTREVGPSAPGSAFAAQVAHFVYIVVERHRLRLWAVDASGQTFDTMMLVGRARPAG